jgi:hypothetical protein
LSRDLFYLVGSVLHTLDETQLIDKIKPLAAKPQDNLINIVKLLGLEQERDEPARNYLVRLKGADNVCEVMVQCTAKDFTEEDEAYRD